MNFLEYLQLANNHKTFLNKDRPFSIGLVTNFTDDILAKILTGVCIKNNITPEIYKVSYKQYSFALKNQESLLWQSYSLVFFFFDISFFIHSEFSGSDDYGDSLLDDLEVYVSRFSGTVVANTFLLPYFGPGGNNIVNHQLFFRVQQLNARLKNLAKKFPNLEIFDINRLVYIFGEMNIRDLRGLYAFDTPFTNDFMTKVAEEWFAYIGALNGKARKVIVLDLDNTLWGGVVGELGPTEIALGPGYPGIAFQNFQRALLEYQKSGILLAINSKNNLADVEEVFEKNPYMVLQKEHFAVIIANWEDKAENLRVLSRQLNLGLDSFVFFDDDPMQRELIMNNLPEVLVPKLGTEPEQYASVLFDLAVFSPFARTQEDAVKNEQYQKEYVRQSLQKKSANLTEFIDNLNIMLDISVNKPEHIPRISQLTLKTNQFNVTTRRYGQKEISDLMNKGLVFSANVKDKFGDYGLTALAIILPDDSSSDRFFIDLFLMSCRILGRGVEFSFLDSVIRRLAAMHKGKGLRAEFIPTPKNHPAKDFFCDFGFLGPTTLEEKQQFELHLNAYCADENSKVYKSIITKHI